MNIPKQINPVYGLLPIVCLSLLLSACSSIEVTSTRCDGKNYATYLTFNWLPQPADSSLEGIASPEIWQLAKSHLEKAMVQNGFEHMQDIDVDFYLTFQITNLERIRGVTLNRLSYQPLWGNYGTRSLSTQYYTKGTMIVDVVDANSREMVWRGTAIGVVGNHQDEVNHKLQEAANKVAEAFVEDCCNN